MCAGTKNLSAVIALLSVAYASGQCVSTSYGQWIPCGSSSPKSCDQAFIYFNIRRATNCVSSNPVVTVDYAGPIANRGYAGGTIDGNRRGISGDVSDDGASLTFDMGESNLDPTYSEAGGYYYWSFQLWPYNCDTSYTWSDSFVQLSYVDDEQNTIDLSEFEDPYISGPDTGTCSTPSPATPSPATPPPPPTPSPTPSPTVLEEPPTPGPTPSPTLINEPPTPSPTPSPTVVEEPPTPGPTPSPTAAGSAPLSLGCFEDDRGNRIMDDLALSDSSMTTELCELTCLGETYFGTQYGRESLRCYQCGEINNDTSSKQLVSRKKTVSLVLKHVVSKSQRNGAKRLSISEQVQYVPLSENTLKSIGYLSTQFLLSRKPRRIPKEIAVPFFASTTTHTLSVCLCCLCCLCRNRHLQCWCGSAGADYALHGESTGCTYTCSGDAGQTCGGFDAANIYPYTGEKASTTIPSFVGCYEDKRSGRIMELALTDASSMTTEVCEAECAGNTYFGTQYGKECFCGGSSTNLLEHGESTACTYECSGDSVQVCGGFNAMSVYSYS
ncbi:unnamed protein product [Pylaiella littoralis]